MNTQSILKLLAISMLSLSMTACGGGGGGGGGGGNAPPGDGPPGTGNPPPQETENHAPTATVSGPGIGLELATVVLEAAGEDADDDDLTFAWRQVEGTAAKVVGDASGKTLTVVLPKVEIMESLSFEVTVSDGADIATAAHAVKVNEGVGLLVIADNEEGTAELFLRHDANNHLVRISEDLAPIENRLPRVIDFAVSPDRRHVAYLVDAEGDDTYRLKLARLDGSGVRDITGVMLDGASVDKFAWSPAGDRIAFLANVSGDSVYELFVVPHDSPDGNDRIAVTGTLSAGLRADDFAWRPQGDELAVTGNLAEPDVKDVFVVPADGSALPVKVSDNEDASHIKEIAWSPDGERLFYRGPFTIDSNELWTVKRDGTARTNVTDGIVTGGEVFEARWSPSGNAIAIRGDLTENNRIDLYVSDLDANGVPGDLRRLSTQTNLAQDVLQGFSWSSDGTELFYRHALEQSDGDGRPNALYRRNASATANLVKISGDSANPEQGRGVHSFAISPDGTQVAFLLDGDVQDKLELYSVPSDTTDPQADRRKLSPGGDGNPDRNLYAFRWSPDSSRILVFGNPESDSLFDLYILPSDGGQLTSVLDGMQADIYTFGWFGPPQEE